MDKTVVNFQRYFTQETDINLGYVNFSSVPYKSNTLHWPIPIFYDSRPIPKLF